MWLHRANRTATVSPGRGIVTNKMVRNKVVSNNFVGQTVPVRLKRERSERVKNSPHVSFIINLIWPQTFLELLAPKWFTKCIQCLSVHNCSYSMEYGLKVHHNIWLYSLFNRLIELPNRRPTQSAVCHKSLTFAAKGLAAEKSAIKLIRKVY